MSKVYVMMSGGVDSSVVASVLKEQGHDVVGVFMKCWSLEQIKALNLSQDLYGCFWEDDSRDAQLVAKKLGIEFEQWDFQEQYRQKVVEYMLQEYRIGKTPNPDVMCNSVIKFGVFFQTARSRGADLVATGHWARMHKTEKGVFIGRGRDENKDQSYFLWRIPQGHLPFIEFPAGNFHTKQELREYATSRDIITASKPDSQGLCFIGQTSLREMLLQSLGEKIGSVVDIHGTILGQHKGAFLYTIGQREKLGLSGGPWFVSDINVESNIVVVSHQSEQESLFKTSLDARDPNWLVNLQSYCGSDKKFRCQAQVRYRQKPETCEVSVVDSQLQVQFEQPVRAIAKGQSIVFYDQDIMLGGAVIT